jgi:hypothetical protein
MRIECAECGCLVDHGVVVEPCHGSECCCLELPRAVEAKRDAAAAEQWGRAAIQAHKGNI